MAVCSVGVGPSAEPGGPWLVVRVEVELPGEVAGGMPRLLSGASRHRLDEATLRAVGGDVSALEAVVRAGVAAGLEEVVTIAVRTARV